MNIGYENKVKAGS